MGTLGEKGMEKAGGKDVEPSRPGAYSPGVYAFGRALSRGALLLMHRMQVRGRENVPAEGGALLVSNHQSFLDIPLIAAALPRHVAFVARDTLMRSGFLAWLMPRSGVILVRRGAADRSAIQAMVGCLRGGGCVAVFPEGTRTSDGTVGVFRAGAAFAAKRARVPIVPVGILGAVDALPRGASLPRPRRIRVSFGRPVAPDAPDALDRARAAVLEMVGDGHWPPGRRPAGGTDGSSGG